MIEHRFQAKQFSGGEVTVVPADVLNSACWNTQYEFITLSFEPSLFAHYTFDSTRIDDARLAECAIFLFLFVG
jgi:AraC family transcriptional regulator